MRNVTVVSLILLGLLGLFSAQSAEAVSLLGYYEFEGNYNDSTTNGNTAAPGQNPGQVSITGAGFRGQAVDINDPAASGGGNTGGSVSLPFNAGPAASPQISFGAWFNLKTKDGNTGVMAIDNGGWDRGVHLLWGGNWGMSSGNITQNIAPASTGQWTYVVATFNKPANRATLYVGDAAAATQVTIAGSRPDGANSGTEPVIEIGRYDNQDLNSLVDDAMVWDEELTAHEANAIRNLRLAPGLDYSPVDAALLFGLFDAGAGTVNVQGTTWELTSGLASTQPGALFDLGNDRYAVVMNDQGDGVQIAVPVVPEPMTMLAVGLSVTGLGGYIRKRRRG